MLEIHTLDADYIETGVAAIYMLVNNGHASFIDTGTNNSLANIESALKQFNISKDRVDYIILTHIHLDHAGGAGQLMSHCPNAQLVVHPYGAKHMINPEKLTAGATAVYGKERFHSLYGEIPSIDADRVIETHDGLKLDFQDEELLFIDTPGHANHHNCIYHAESKSCFTGDTFGICYPHLSDVSKQPLLPTTTPVQFSPEKMMNSIDKVMALKPAYLYLTHYGKYTIHPLSIIQLKEHVMRYCQLAERAFSEGDESNLQGEILDYMVNQIESPSKDVRTWLTMDANLNAQGLNVWQKKLSQSNN